MIKVAGLWELGWNTPMFEHDLWAFPLRDFGIEEWYMSPVSGIQSTAVREVPDIGVFLQEQRTSGIQVVHFDEKGEIDLEGFIHPEHALYVFGKAGVSSLRGYGKDGDQSVRIRTQNHLGTLWPHQALSIVLYDRLRKSWQ